MKILKSVAQKESKANKHGHGRQTKRKKAQYGSTPL
jgi:hypothetical protein